MTAFKHILVPTDFGEAADRALEVALTLASSFDAKLTLLHASQLPPLSYEAYWPADEMAKRAKAKFDRVLATARGRRASVEGVVFTGEPWETILRTARDRGADLIVMGTHGRRGLSRVLFGSVAGKVVRLSPIPVLTVPGKEEEDAKALAPASPTITPPG